MGRNALTREKVQRINDLDKAGLKPKAIAEELEIAIGTVYKYLVVPRTKRHLQDSNKVYEPLLDAYYNTDKPLKVIFENAPVSKVAFYDYLTRNGLQTRRERKLAPDKDQTGVLNPEDSAELSDLLTG